MPFIELGTMMLPCAGQANDPNSHAQPDQVRVTHLDLEFEIDFVRRRLQGSATLSLDWTNRQATTLVLDTRDLTIARVEALPATGEALELAHLLEPADEHLGSKLTITAPLRPPRVRIDYTTSPQASGLQWLTPEQTADHHAPFMFSQSESIHARSWVPLQDSPAVRFTYLARARAPLGIRVVMSALNDATHPLDGEFRFEQPHPIPSYLLAICAGHLSTRQTGPRSAVYAEPSVVEVAAREFEDTEKLIAATERLYGPYAWGRYDILVLPPSFPFGGMENPNMTFATPTVLVGDKSLVSLVSHELAHSWSGNLVTAATWRDIWLNEGFTTYVQGRITEAVYGKVLADEEALLAARALQKKIVSMEPNLQKLAPDPRGLRADDTLTAVAYHKGCWFLRTLESRFGREVFDDYLRGYFRDFAFRSITTEDMLAYLRPRLLEKNPGRMRWEEVTAWIYDPGIPEHASLPDSPRFAVIDRARGEFLGGALAAVDLDAQVWNTQEWMYFLDRLPDVAPLDKLQQLDAAWHLSGTANAEIGMRWYTHAIASGDKAAWPAAGEHMRRIGRLYLTTPLYKAFAKTPAGLAYAEQVYALAMDGYHPMTQKAVETIFAKAKEANTHGKQT
ncbi:MAG: M1 family metallopeptidase [Rhodanobacter sp.]